MSGEYETPGLVPTGYQNVPIFDPSTFAGAGAMGRPPVILESDPSLLRFHRYCRLRGAEDVFDLFHMRRRGEPLIAHLVRRHPWEATAVVLGFLDANRKLLSDDVARFVVGRTERRPLLPQDVAEITDLIARGFQNAGRQEHPFFVPIFCAHPCADPDVQVALTVSEKASSQVNFSVNLPGVSGGLTTVTTTGFTIEHDFCRKAIQYQQEMLCVVKSWRRTDGVEIRTYTMAPSSPSQIAYEGGPGYIDYQVPVRLDKHIHEDISFQTGGGDPDPEKQTNVMIDKKFSSEFSFKLKLPGGSLDYKIESATEKSFLVKYRIVPGYRYRFSSYKADCHDVFVEAMPLG